MLSKEIELWEAEKGEDAAGHSPGAADAHCADNVGNRKERYEAIRFIDLSVTHNKFGNCIHYLRLNFKKPVRRTTVARFGEGNIWPRENKILDISR